MLRRWHEDALSQNSSAAAGLTCALNVWVKLLRSGQREVWVEEVTSMEKRLLLQGSVGNLKQLAQAMGRC